MVNVIHLAVKRAKPVEIFVLLLAITLTFGLNRAQALDELQLNIFPTIGKPIYAVAEFDLSVSDPVSVTVASEAEYQKAGYSRPAFFNTANVRKLGTNRYLITNTTPVDSANFPLILDAQFKEFRRIYPIEISLNKGQVTANFAVVKEYDQPAKTQVSKVRKPIAAPVEVKRTPLSTPVVQRVQEPQYQQFRPATLLSAPQPQVFYPPSNPQPSSSSSEQFPFYLVVIVLTVLILVAMFVVVLFMHKNHDPRHLAAQHDQHSLVSDLLKALPSLVGANAQANQNAHQRLSHSHTAQTASAQQPMHLPQPWRDAEQPAWNQSHMNAQMDYAQREQASQVQVPEHPPEQPRMQPSPSSAANPSQAKKAVPPTPEPPAQPVHSAAPKSRAASPARSAQAPKVQTNQNQTAPKNPSKAPQPSLQNSGKGAQQDTAPTPSAAKAADKSEKLQLAIVYLNMGDEVMARMLLDEIGREGAVSEQIEAKEILAKMNQSSGRSIIADQSDKTEQGTK